MAPNIGINVDAVAVLEVNSVNIIIMATLNNTIKIIEIESKLLLKAPIQAANPDELITLASARPPPINIKAPHGIFWTTSQSINLFLFFSFEGNINKIIAANIAIEESFIAPIGIVFSRSEEIHFLEIHKKAVKIKTTPTKTSSWEIFPKLFILFFIILSLTIVSELIGKHR